MQTFSIYRIVNKNNGRSYIGVTRRSLDVRCRQHFYDALVRGSPWTFHKAIRKHGRDAWYVEMLARAATPAEAYAREQAEIVAYGTRGKAGYNATLGGEGAPGMTITPGHRDRIIASNRTRKLSDETIERMAAAKRGRKAHPKALEALAAAREQPCTPKRRKAISEALTGHATSAETRRKIGAANTGNRHSPELVAAIAEKNRGANSRIAKTFVATHPDGRTETVKGLVNFCAQHGLNSSGVRRCLAGKLHTHHGFRFEEIPQ